MCMSTVQNLDDIDVSCKQYAMHPALNCTTLTHLSHSIRLLKRVYPLFSLSYTPVTKVSPNSAHSVPWGFPQIVTNVKSVHSIF